MDEKRGTTEQPTQTKDSSQQAEPQKIAENPNPRANENIQQSSFDQQREEDSNQVGSEITDGEDA